MRLQARGFVLLLIILATSAVFAQTDIDTTILTSRILPTARPTQDATEAAFRALKEEPVGLKYLFAPFFLSSDGVRLAQATVGVIRPTKYDTRATFSYTYIDPDGGEHLDNLGVALRQGIVSSERGTVKALASYSDTRDASTKTQLGAVGEAVFSRGLSAGVDARWVRSSAGDGVDDIVPRVFGSLERGRVTFAADYTLENDVDETDDYSGEVGVATSRGIVVIGAGKNSTWYVNFVKVF